MIGKVTMPSGIVVTLKEDGEYVVTLPAGMHEKYANIVAGQLTGYDPNDPKNGDGSWHLNYLASCCDGVVELGSGFRPRPGQCILEGYENLPRRSRHKSAIIIGKVTTEDGIVATLHSDWFWDVTGPEDMPPELAKLIKHNLEDEYYAQRPHQGGDTWPLYKVAALENGTVEVISGRGLDEDDDDPDVVY